MNSSLVKVEKGQLIIAVEVINKIIDLENKKKKLDEMEREFKTKIETIMEENNIKSFESNDKRLKISYTNSTIAKSFDTKNFELEHNELYKQYLKETTRKGSARITIRDEGK